LIKFENKGSLWEIPLGKPCGKAYPANTKYVKTVILALNGGMLYFDDLKFEELLNHE